jgi:tetratricopeptide (TPR) repeat protein
MAESEDQTASAGAAEGPSAAASIALGEAAAEGRLDPRAAAYLEEQTRFTREQMRLARLQIENLQKLDAYETSHLRWRRFYDQMKGALQIMLVAVGALVVVGIGATIWNASHADGLVVDSFTAPPDFAAHGVNGEVLATDLTNHIAAIRDFANARSLARSGTVQQDSSQDIKVEIPDTGVSVGEVWRYLRNWLGHEHHVSGSLHRLANGDIELWALLDGDVVLASGPPADLDALEQKVAEGIFAHVDPINEVIYLWDSKRYAAAQKQAGENTLIATAPDVRADSYALWSETTFSIAGDIPLAIARDKVALALDPTLAIADVTLAEAEHALGHDEAALRDDRAALAQKEAGQPVFLQGAGFTSVQDSARGAVAAYLGDFAVAMTAACGRSCMPSHLDDEALYAVLRHDASHALSLLRTASALNRTDSAMENRVRYDAALAAADWAGALAAARARPELLRQVAGKDTTGSTAIDAMQTGPQLAYVLARSGAFAQADALIAGTPLDCYDCLRIRGNIRAAEKNWNAATFWFARAVAQAPSIPFAYCDWGQMLLAKGDLDGAFAKLKLANQKGPHFADPLEMWGEALITKNRADQALDKFEEADKYAPNWGRLHLKWGEALLWSGKRDEARKQFAIAATLDLTPSKKTELARAAHG